MGQLFSPGGLVAGRVLRKGIAPVEAVYNALAFAVDSDQVAFIYFNDGEYVDYIGARASEFSSVSDPETPFMSVLSGPAGAYLFDEGASATLIIKTFSSYRVYSGTRQELELICADEQLVPTELDSKDCVPWETRRYFETRAVSANNRRMRVILAGFSVVAFGIAFVLSILANRTENDAVAVRLALETQFESAVANLSKSQPVDDTLSELQRVRAVALRTGGWIEEFRVVNGRSVYTLMVPQWITQDYLDLLPDVSAEIDRSSGMIRLEKI